MQRLIHVRRRPRAFGRGSTEYVDCGNQHVLAFVRRHLDETLLVLANLADSPQTQLHLLRFARLALHPEPPKLPYLAP